MAMLVCVCCESLLIHDPFRACDGVVFCVLAETEHGHVFPKCDFSITSAVHRGGRDLDLNNEGLTWAPVRGCKWNTKYRCGDN